MEIDELSVSMVVDEGVPLKLEGDDRLAAIRIMAERGIPWREQARRLMIHYTVLSRAATYQGITLNPNPSKRIRELYCPEIMKKR